MDNDISEKLGALLSNPDAMAKIAGLASTLGLGAQHEAEKESREPCSSCMAKEAARCDGSGCALSGKNGKLSETAKSIACSRALLQALKPYLSAERCARIDKILGMMKIAELMGYLG
jgi:hypothetical protein